MWPFSSAPQRLTQEQRERCHRRCGLALGTLEHCLRSNAGNPAICISLETQVVHCHAEVVCPEAAAEHQKCFQRVVNSKGREPFSACDKHVAAMKKCLRQHGVFPFAPSSGSVAGGGTFRQRRPAAAAAAAAPAPPA